MANCLRKASEATSSRYTQQHLTGPQLSQSSLTRKHLRQSLAEQQHPAAAMLRRHLSDCHILCAGLLRLQMQHSHHGFHLESPQLANMFALLKLRSALLRLA